MPYVAKQTLASAVSHLKGTADHMLKIWFVLKQMGMTPDNPVEIDTGNSTDALKRLFDYGDPEGKFYIPFAHTKRYLTMESDASRSIIQTNLKRWAVSDSVVTLNPKNYLSMHETPTGKVRVQPGRIYPEGLGYGKDGFALKDKTRVNIPFISFGLWYYRDKELPETENFENLFKQRLQEDLHLTNAEMEQIFSFESPDFDISLQSKPLKSTEIYEIVSNAIEEPTETGQLVEQTWEEHIMQVRSRTTPTAGRPTWINADPEELLKGLLARGSKSILLYGPPRTGKTRAVLNALSGKDVAKIQIHDGWGYDELMIGLRPEANSGWSYRSGPLHEAITRGKKYIVLEEINRTDFSQAIGEVFSLIEDSYRGSDHSIVLRNNEPFFIPDDVVIICTMNTLDRSTENVDDALFGRMDAVEFPPRVEDLDKMLSAKGVNDTKWRDLFAFLQDHHPVGHGYFATLTPDTRPTDFYRARLRPVLQKHLQGYREDALIAIDEKVDQLFGS